jgi:hypothetical protein
MTVEDHRRFAAIVPVGPGQQDMCRALLLLASLVRHEPQIGWCVIVEDTPRPRGLAELALFPKTCHPVALLNPRNGRGKGWSGGLCTGVLTGLAWIQANTDADFALKIDTDALVIAPFAAKIRGLMAEVVDAGVIGTLGLSCNPYVRVVRDLRRKPTLLRLFEQLPITPTGARNGNERINVRGVGSVLLAQLRDFDAIRGHVQAAIENGYATDEFCLGGAYAVSRRMIDTMADRGYCDEPTLWADLPVPEDMAIAMYCKATALRICDYSGYQEPFGLQYVALPYPLDELAARGHSIIHSIKNDPRHTEAEIHAYFQ